MRVLLTIVVFALSGCASDSQQRFHNMMQSQEMGRMSVMLMKLAQPAPRPPSISTKCVRVGNEIRCESY